MEFIGKARQLRSRISTANAGFHDPVENKVRILQPLWQVTPQHIMRQERLQKLVDFWQKELPAFGRLRLNWKLRKGDLLIKEHRLTVGRTTFFAWEDGEAEPSISIELVSFECNPRKFLFDPTCLIVISLHALARRYQRCKRCDDIDIMQDIAATIDAYDVAMQLNVNDTFEIACPHGRWLGYKKETHFNHDRGPCPTLAIRTFIDERRDALAA